MTIYLSDSQKRQYQEEGYFILPEAVSNEHLELLRNDCQYYIDEINADTSCNKEGNLGAKRHDHHYVVGRPSLRSPALRAVIYNSLIEDICKATIGQNAYLSWEQYVVKMPHSQSEIGWHQDGAYELAHGAREHAPGVSCWCALDDMSEANGAISVLSYSRAGTRDIVEHIAQENLNGALMGYFGNDPGKLIVVPAGSIIVFSDTVFHRSGSNVTDSVRRAYLINFAPEELTYKDSSEGFGCNELFLKNGQSVIRGEST